MMTKLERDTMDGLRLRVAELLDACNQKQALLDNAAEDQRGMMALVEEARRERDSWRNVSVRLRNALDAMIALEPPCPDCHGTGQEGTGQPSDEGGEAFQACAKCNGSGLAHGLYPHSDSCAECGGDGRAYPTPMHREAAASIALDRDQTHYVGDGCPGGHRGGGT